ncbi:MAG TPA: hypothetical protein PKC43_13595, partial [Phycisphaerales bacterium]|nr:hypothetical protein [Phycisphaerales bacterium]
PPEGEPGGPALNGGCNAFPPVFSAIACQDVICGDAWASGGTRDTDWYELQLADATEITFTVFGTLPMVIGLVNTGGVPDCNLATALNPFAVAPFCGTATLTVCLEPGTWWLFAAPNTFDGFPCGSQNLYWIKLECAGPCAPPSVCEGADHPCGTTGGPGCSDVACCTLVCSIDPFCCEVAWDLLCVIQAQELCVPPGVPNDNCANALPIALGATAFSTVGATTDGPDLPMMCEEGFGLTFVNDIWYVFTATQTGNLTVSTCGTANYDTRLAAYQGAGCFGPIVACNDDGPGCPGFTSLMVVPTTVGQPYLIRIGGFGGSGSGTVSLSY